MAEPTLVPTLLPSNVTPQEKALEGATARLGDVPVPVGNLWSPENCPAPLLAWLAWAFSVDEWDTAWSESVKRQVIAESVQVHLHKGSVASVRRALTAMGFTEYVLTEWWQDAPEEGAAFHTGEPHTYSLGINPLEPGPTYDPELFDTVLRTLAATAPVRSHLALYVRIQSAAELGIAGYWRGYTHRHADAAMTREPTVASGQLGIAAAWRGYTHVHFDSEWQASLDQLPLRGITDGLLMHLIAEDLGATLIDDDPVPTWADRTGNVTVTAAGAEQPSYRTGVLGGLGVVRFNGVANRLSQSSPNPLAVILGATGLTVFVVLANIAAKDPGPIVSTNNDGVDDFFLLYSESAVFSGAVTFQTESDLYFTEGVTAITGGPPHVVTGLFDGTAGAQEIYMDGVLDADDAAAIPATMTVNGNTLYVGGHLATDGSNKYMQGDIAEIALYDRALSTPERESVEEHLMLKYSIV